ncbi:MAG: DeoR/GlpR family DNA-binding transcription regulator [Clostridiales Family XIII bacterium]|nr:DeoR/GlpR family DNA-binding transcription regulator [Clostridiales Family XIII bacterium]
MTINNRKERIMEILRSGGGFATVEQLSGVLFVSCATVRRDLQELDASRLIYRTRGGALLLESITNEDPLVIRENRNEAQKQIIAKAARRHIKDGMTLFFDSSTTVLTLARSLEQFNNLRIITNNLKAAFLLSERKGITVMCTGGLLREGSKSFFGQSAVEYIRRLNADAAFLSARGFSITNGASEANEEEYYIKQAYIANSQQSFLLCDISKINKDYLYRTAPLSSYAKVITESRDINELCRKAMEEAGKAYKVHNSSSVGT